MWTRIFSYPEKKSCGFKNILIRVDGAFVFSSLRKGTEGKNLCNEVINSSDGFLRDSVKHFNLKTYANCYRSHPTQTAKYSQKCSCSRKKSLLSLRCDYFHSSALFGGHFFYKSCIEILKYCAVVVSVSVRQRSEGRIFVVSTIYIRR